MKFHALNQKPTGLLVGTFLVLLIAFLSSCSQNKIQANGDEGGSGSQTTNTISGKVVDSTGTPVSGVRINLVASTHNTALIGALPDSAVQYTDEEGNFSFSGFEKDLYTLEAYANSRGTGNILDSLNHSGGVTDLEDIPLLPLSSVDIPTEGLELRANDKLYIPGTTILLVIDSSMLNGQYVSIDSIPVGMYDSIAVVRDEEIHVVDVGVDVMVDSIIPVGPFFLWKYQAELVLDEKEIKSFISADLINYPFLVRLDGENFDFDQALPAGEDFRIVNASGDNVPFEIELWDSQKKSAVLWIHIDTLFSNKPFSKYTLYWGNEIAKPLDNKQMVFKSENGFLAVYHLAENPYLEESHSILDATDNGFHLTPFGSFSDSSQASSILGHGIYFDGTDGYLNSVADHEGDFSVSMWAKAAKIKQAEWSGLFSIAPHPLFYNFQIDMEPENEIYRIYMGAGFDPDTANVRPFGKVKLDYQYLTLTKEKSSVKMYVDGVLVDTSSHRHNIKFSMFKIGENRGGDKHYHGIIDELRVSDKARSEEWVHLNYRLQKIDSRLYNIEK